MKSIFTFYYALKDQRTPWYSKITALLAIVYLISPADILPDIIPLAGYADDLIIVPFLFNIATKLLPQDVRVEAERRSLRNAKKLFWIKVLLIIAVIALMTGLFFLATRLYEYMK